MSLACHTSFPVGSGKSIQRLRHDVQHPGSGALHGDYHIACHIVGAPHEEERRREGEEKEDEDKVEEAKRKRKRRRTDSREREMAAVQDEGETRARRMWTLTALQYTQGHGIYKPPQFYLHPSRAYITPRHQNQTFYSSLEWWILYLPPTYPYLGSFSLPQRVYDPSSVFASSVSSMLIAFLTSPSTSLLILRLST